ncbi:MAG: oxidoreductase [Candidatus Cloacimonadota bacterium]|nr:MAG: oxidoreductase [Candidatus Cloacimonadota bacterium]
MAKPKVAFYWCASCGGCEEAIVDLAENILPVVEAVDIVLWPVALDFKRKDIEAMKDGEIAVSFINGAIRSEEQEEMVKLLRRKSQIVIAFGSCAYLGGIPGLANLFTRQEILDTVYFDAPSVVNPNKILPQLATDMGEGEVTLPELHECVKTLDQVIAVEYYIPGCAPPPDLISEALTAILEGKLPAVGSVLAPQKTLCDTCPRKDSKPEKISVSEVKRMAFTQIPDDKCFLSEGVICLGPATISGCGTRCINANMPCRGCFGPSKAVKDQGAKFLSAFASLIDSEDEEEIKKITDSVIDPAGLFYMFSLPSSLKAKFFEREV